MKTLPYTTQNPHDAGPDDAMKEIVRLIEAGEMDHLFQEILGETLQLCIQHNKSGPGDNIYMLQFFKENIEENLLLRKATVAVSGDTMAIRKKLSATVELVGVGSNAVSTTLSSIILQPIAAAEVAASTATTTTTTTKAMKSHTEFTADGESVAIRESTVQQKEPHIVTSLDIEAVKNKISIEPDAKQHIFSLHVATAAMASVHLMRNTNSSDGGRDRRRGMGRDDDINRRRDNICSVSGSCNNDCDCKSSCNNSLEQKLGKDCGCIGESDDSSGSEVDSDDEIDDIKLVKNNLTDEIDDTKLVKKHSDDEIDDIKLVKKEVQSKGGEANCEGTSENGNYNLVSEKEPSNQKLYQENEREINDYQKNKTHNEIDCDDDDDDDDCDEVEDQGMLIKAGNILDRSIKEFTGNMPALQNGYIALHASGELEKRTFLRVIDDNITACKQAGYINKQKLLHYIRNFIEGLESDPSSKLSSTLSPSLLDGTPGWGLNHAPQFQRDFNEINSRNQSGSGGKDGSNQSSKKLVSTYVHTPSTFIDWSSSSSVGGMKSEVTKRKKNKGNLFSTSTLSFLYLLSHFSSLLFYLTPLLSSSLLFSSLLNFSDFTFQLFANF